MRVKATFRVMSADLQPELVSERLGMQADLEHKKGQARPGHEERSRARYSMGQWSLLSSRSEEDSPVAHIDHLLSRVAGAEKKLQSLRSEGVRIDIFLGVFLDGGNEGFSLPLTTIKALTDASVDLELDLYTV